MKSIAIIKDENVILKNLGYSPEGMDTLTKAATLQGALEGKLLALLSFHATEESEVSFQELIETFAPFLEVE